MIVTMDSGEAHKRGNYPATLLRAIDARGDGSRISADLYISHLALEISATPPGACSRSEATRMRGAIEAILSRIPPLPESSACSALAAARAFERWALCALLRDYGGEAGAGIEVGHLERLVLLLADAGRGDWLGYASSRVLDSTLALREDALRDESGSEARAAANLEEMRLKQREGEERVYLEGGHERAAEELLPANEASLYRVKACSLIGVYHAGQGVREVLDVAESEDYEKAGKSFRNCRRALDATLFSSEMATAFTLAAALLGVRD